MPERSFAPLWGALSFGDLRGTIPAMLKLIVLVILFFWLARQIARLIPNIEITIDQGGREDVRVFAVMREHFPDQYERYKHGLLSETEERELYLDCVEILGARQEIERL